MNDEKMSMHVIIRTSPKGKDFVGKCKYCGKRGLRMIDAQGECPKAPNHTVADELRTLLKW